EGAAAASGGDAGAGGAGRAHAAPAVGAVGRAAPAGGDRAGAGERAGAAAGGRADGQPGQPDGRGDHGAVRRAAAPWPDDRACHARARHRRARPPRDHVARRLDRERRTERAPPEQHAGRATDTSRRCTVRAVLRNGLVAAVSFFAGVAALACGESEAKEGNGELQLAVAERRSLEILAEAAGLIEPVRLVEVKSKASGEVLRIHVETGQDVERGALLVEIDPRDVRNSFAQAEADLAVAEARLATTEAQKQRVEELRKANVVTEQEYESAALEEANARAQLVKARTNLELARERLGDVTVRAPIDGTIIQRSVEIGTIIASASQNISGGTLLLTMADLSQMQVRTLVDETDIGQIRPGQTARVMVEAYPGRVFTGEVLKIEPQAVVDQNVTMFPVLVLLDNAER